MIETGIADVRIQELKAFHDARGWLAEVWRMDSLDHSPAMAYVSVTASGMARGPHEHRLQTDYFVMAGPGDFAVYLFDNRPESPTYRASFSATFGEQRPAALLLPPRVIHAYRCVSQGAAWVLNMPDKLYAGTGKREPVDEIRHEDHADSVFYTAFDPHLFRTE